MNPIKLFRKLGKLLRGGAGPWETFMGCLLGMAIGMTPGFNMTVIIAIALLLLLNANVALASIAFVIGKVLCLVLAPVTFQIGFFVIHGIGLEGLFGAISRTPVLALMGLHYYCLVGGLPLALVLGLAMGWMVSRVVRLARVAIIAGGERSERFGKISRNVLVRIILRIVFGKQKKPLAEMLHAKRPVFRKAGVILCVIMLAGVLVFEQLYADRLAASGLKAGIETAAGAEVNIEEVDFSLLGGRLRVKGLQVTDRQKPTHNLVRIDALEGDIAITDLLAGRLVLEKVRVGRIERDVKRAAPGEVFEKTERPKPKLPDVTISDYFERGEKALEYLGKLRDYLNEREENRRKDPQDQEDLKKLARLKGHFKASAESVLARRPVVTIQLLEIDQVHMEGAGTYSLRGKEVSDSPELNSLPMKLTITDEKGFHGEVELNFTGETPRHTFLLKAPDVPLGDTVRLSQRVPLDVTQARADIVASGEFATESVDVGFEIQLRDLQASPSGGRGFLGLDPVTAAKVFEQISTMKIVGGLKGPLAGPRPWVDEKAIMNGLKGTLAEAGKNALASMVGKQADKFIGKVPLPIDKSALGGVLQGIGGLVKPDKGKDGDAEGKDKDKTTTKPAGILDRLPKVF